MNNPLVTVVVPTYNRASLIVDALASVYEQTYRPLQLIVVDDGSTDDSNSVVSSWITGHAQIENFSVKYIYQDNQGGNVARNRGITEAAGEYVAFLDSDDLWHDNKLQLQMELFRDIPEVGGVYCGIRHIKLASGEVLALAKRRYPSGKLLDSLLVHDVTAPTSTYVIRKDVFEKVGSFDEELQARQDWDMWIRLASAYEIGVVPEVLVDYREHAGVRTATDPQKEITAYKIIMEKYSTLRDNCSLAVRQSAKSAFYRRMGRVHFHHKISNIKAIGYYLRAIISWPSAFDNYAALFGMMLPASVRQKLHKIWNHLFGATRFAIRSH